MSSQMETDPNSWNKISTGTKVTGEIITNEAIRIDGHLKGNITTKDKLIVGETGIIIGDINCNNSDIFGKVEGKIFATELLALKASSNVKGDIITNKLSVEPGAIFSGSCDMSGNRTKLSNGKKTGKQES